MDDQAQVRFGLIGTGWIASVVAPAMMGPRCILTAVGSRSLEKAQVFAKKHGGKGYGSYQEVVDAKDVDVLYIALPTDQHKEWALAAAAAGKHCICEKPVAPTAADVKEIVDAFAAANLQFMDATHWVHHPRTETFKQLIAGLEKPATNVAATFHWQQADPNNIRLNPELEPQGSIGDLCWYTAVAANVVYGEKPTSVMATLRRTIAPRPDSKNTTTPVIMGGQAICKFSNDRTAVLTFDFDLLETQWVQVSNFDTTITLKDFVWPHNLQDMQIDVRKLLKGGFHTGGGIETLSSSLGDNTRAFNLFDNFAKAIQSGVLNTEWPSRSLAVTETLEMIVTASPSPFDTGC